MQANNVTMTNTVIKSILGITPPVLLDKTGLGSFLAYLKEHDKKTLPDTAAAEATRLAPYFAAMDQRLARAAPVEKGGTQERSILTYILPRAILPYKPIDRYRPGTLKSIFENVAPMSQNIILSQMSVIPDSYLNSRAVTKRVSNATLLIDSEKTKKPA